MTSSCHLQPQWSHSSQRLHSESHRSSCSRSTRRLRWCPWWGKRTAAFLQQAATETQKAQINQMDKDQEAPFYTGCSMLSVMAAQSKKQTNAGDIISFLSQIMSNRWPAGTAFPTHIYLRTSLNEVKSSLQRQHGVKVKHKFYLKARKPTKTRK